MRKQTNKNIFPLSLFINLTAAVSLLALVDFEFIANLAKKI